MQSDLHKTSTSFGSTSTDRNNVGVRIGNFSAQKKSILLSGSPSCLLMAFNHQTQSEWSCWKYFRFCSEIAAMGRLGAPILWRISVDQSEQQKNRTHSLNNIPSRKGFISICSFGPNCRFSLSSCVQPKNAHGLLKSCQNSNLISSHAGMLLFLALRGTRLKSGFESLSMSPALRFSFIARSTASRKCMRSWPQKSRPFLSLPALSIHTASESQKAGTPGVPRWTARSVALSSSSRCFEPSKIPSSIALMTSDPNSKPEDRTQSINTVLSLTFFPSTQ